MIQVYYSDMLKYIKEHITDILNSEFGVSNTNKNFKCITGHKDNTPSMSFDRNSLRCKCFSCGKSFDALDLIGEKYNISDVSEQIKKACEVLGVEVLKDKETYKATAKTAYPLQDKRTDIEVASTIDEEPISYIDLYKEAFKNVNKTNYLSERGISSETAKKFIVGYIEEWTHPKAQGATPTSRVIIPITPYSYVARATDKDIDKRYAKMKVKGKESPIWIFNRKIISEEERAIFCVEGEFDSLSVAELGYPSIAIGSVANINQFIEVLEKDCPKCTMVLCLDNDNAGAEAQKELKAKLDAIGVKCIEANIAGEYKDANEALINDREKLENTLENIYKSILTTTEEYIKTECANSYLQDFISNIGKGAGAPPTPTGFKNLDTILDGGLFEGLYVIGALSSLGKTTFCLQIAEQIAQAGRDVLIFSLEMAREELIAKSVSRNTAIYCLEKGAPFDKAKTTRGITNSQLYSNYNAYDLEIIEKAIEAYSGYASNIFITEGVGNIGVDEVRGKIEKHISITGRTPIVIIDYLQILAPHNDRATDKQNTDKAVLELKRITRDLKTPILAISSFNRDSYREPVNLSSFKESGAIEYSSDVLIGLQYEGLDRQKGEKDKDRADRIDEILETAKANANTYKGVRVQLKILKNRNGKRDNCLFTFRPMFNWFTEA